MGLVSRITVRQSMQLHGQTGTAGFKPTAKVSKTCCIRISASPGPKACCKLPAGACKTQELQRHHGLQPIGTSKAAEQGVRKFLAVCRHSTRQPVTGCLVLSRASPLHTPVNALCPQQLRALNNAKCSAVKN